MDKGKNRDVTLFACNDANDMWDIRGKKYDMTQSHKHYTKISSLSLWQDDCNWRRRRHPGWPYVFLLIYWCWRWNCWNPLSCFVSGECGDRPTNRGASHVWIINGLLARKAITKAGNVQGWGKLIEIPEKKDRFGLGYQPSLDERGNQAIKGKVLPVHETFTSVGHIFRGHVAMIDEVAYNWKDDEVPQVFHN